MKKKRWIIALISVLVILFVLNYLSQIILAAKIKDLLVKGIEEATEKKVSLDALNVSIFKGLVIKNLVIYDEGKRILTLKECSLNFFIFPLFKKQLVIPTVRLKSPVIFIERRADNSINILEPFLKERAPTKEAKFNLFINKIIIRDGQINFQDDTLSPVFTKEVKHLNLILSLALPTKVKFNLNLEIPAPMPIKVNSLGEYNLIRQELAAKITVKDLSPKEFLAYYGLANIDFPSGTIDLLMSLRLQDEIIDAHLEAQTKDVVISSGKVLSKLNSVIKTNLKYTLKEKELQYSGNADISSADISGLEYIDKISDIKGEVKFNHTGLSAQNLTGNILGLPIQGQLNLTDFKHPLLNLNLSSSLDLNAALGILKEKFRLTLPLTIQGQGKLSLVIQSKIPLSGVPEISGSLNILNAHLKLDTIPSFFENINGRLQFNLKQIIWSDLKFRYLNTDYETSGTLTNFQAPGVQLKLSSPDLKLATIFALKNKALHFSEFAGRYLNLEFALAGNVDITDPVSVDTDISGRLDLELGDLKTLFKELKIPWKQIRPSGLVQVAGNLRGNIKDIKSCAIDAKLASNSVSVLGLKATDFSATYIQENGLTDIPLLHLALYEGTIDASAKMNFASENLPYWLNLDIQGVKIEQLKMDTPLKKQDIAGILQAQIKINGFSNDLSEINGTGKILISEGKLWQLNLFKGLGVLLFTTDFNNIIFSEGYCDFLIQDKYVFTDNLTMKSNLVNLSGVAKIGFDSSLDAAFNVEVSSDAPLTGTFKDITTAILGQANRFGVIKITGTLKEPKYTLKPAVIDILQGLKDIFFKQ